jgi:Protein of unknown function (DUF4232)
MIVRQAAAVTAVAAIVAVSVGACAANTRPGSMPAPTQPAPSPSASAECPEPGVLIQLAGGDAAMGLRELTLSMTNCGEQAYQVNGYPDVRVLDDQGQPLDVRIERGTSTITADPSLTAAPQPVTLPPGGTATAVVVWRNLVTDPSVVATTGASLRIAPATGAPAQTVTPRGGIDLGNTGRLAVSPWKAATS